MWWEGHVACNDRYRRILFIYLFIYCLFIYSLFIFLFMAHLMILSVGCLVTNEFA